MVNENEVLEGLKRELDKAKKLLKGCQTEQANAEGFLKNKETFLAAAIEGEQRLKRNLRSLRDEAQIVSLEEWKTICAEVMHQRHFIKDLKEQIKLAQEQVNFFKGVVADNTKIVEDTKAEIKRVKKLAKGAKILKFKLRK